MLCLNVLNDSNSVLSRCMCVGEGGGRGFLDISTAECVVETFTLHKSEKHIHNIKTIFYLHDCISFNDLPYSNQPFLLHTLGAN